MVRSQAAQRPPALALECLEPRCTPAITWNVTFDDSAGTYAAYDDEIRATLIAAGNDWARFFHSANASIEVLVDFSVFSDNAYAGSTSYGSVQVGKNGNLTVREQGVGYEIRTGKDPNGSTPDAHITINPNHLTTDLWFDPTPSDREDDVIPLGMADAYSVLLHELGHCIGFKGFRDHATGNLPGTDESTFDKFITIAADGQPYFNGPAAEAANGNLPVPLTQGNLYHVRDTDLMNGSGLPHDRRDSITALDIAILQDIGLPISNDPPVIAPISDQFVHTDGSGTVAVSLTDRETATRDLQVSVDSSDQGLIPTESLNFSGLGSDRTLALNPIPGQEGLTTITIHLNDGYVETTRSFNVRVSVDEFPWRNPTLSLDVDGDTFVAPSDPVAIISRLNDPSFGPGPLPWREPRTATAPFYDVHADNMLAADDAVDVISYLNNRDASSISPPGGEGEQSSDQTALLLMLMDTSDHSPTSKPRQV